MILKPGLQLKSTVDGTQVVVVKAPSDDIDIRCGGHPMVPTTDDAEAPGPLAVEHSSGTLVGKRYEEAALGLELLCSKPGEGSLSIGDEPLLLKDAKPLPSSD